MVLLELEVRRPNKSQSPPACPGETVTCHYPQQATINLPNAFHLVQKEQKGFTHKLSRATDGSSGERKRSGGPPAPWLSTRATLRTHIYNLASPCPQSSGSQTGTPPVRAARQDGTRRDPEMTPKRGQSLLGCEGTISYSYLDPPTQPGP